MNTPEQRKGCTISFDFQKNIAHYGTACQICGFDFGKAYGPAFAGKIEVHHIVPLSEIREDYAVDPIHDLIPVCSNCHTALHSKKDGVQTDMKIHCYRITTVNHLMEHCLLR